MHDQREDGRSAHKERPSERDAESAHKERDVAAEIARLSVLEIAAALHATNAPRLVRAAISMIARVPSTHLGLSLARFDARIDDVGLSRAAREVLLLLGATISVDGEDLLPAQGPVLVVSNHPGAYDALALMAALERRSDDVMIVASDRGFLRAMPRLAKHLVFLSDDPRMRVRAIRDSIRFLDDGRVVVQFGAGAIEPDARFVDGGDVLLNDEWSEGSSWFAAHAVRKGARILPVFVSGVHSPRAKRLRVVRWAERRGITTIAPLIQATLPGFRDVATRVSIGSPIVHGGAMSTRALRDAVLKLAPIRR